MQKLNMSNQLLLVGLVKNITLDTLTNMIVIVLAIIIITLLLIRTIEYLKKPKKDR